MIEDFDLRKTEKLLSVLNYEIDQKCFELKENKRNGILKRLFFIGCILSVVLPVLDAFTGFSIVITLIPIILFQAVSLICLIPLILNLNGGSNHVESVG